MDGISELRGAASLRSKYPIQRGVAGEAFSEIFLVDAKAA
jgi:hypothetical protein